MKLLLAIETSWDQPRVILGDSVNRLFDSYLDCTEAHSRELLALVSTGLEASGAQVHDICAIVINVGPGRLTSIRTGVAFSNALAFSLTIPIYPFNYFEIVARQVSKIYDLLHYPPCQPLAIKHMLVYLGEEVSSRCISVPYHPPR